MMPNARALLLSISLTLGLFACGDGGDHDHTDDDVPMDPNAGGGGSGGGGTGGSTGSITGGGGSATRTATARLIVVNAYASTTITGLYLSPSEEESWGNNQLNYALNPGGQLTLSGIPCDEYYDLLVKGAGGVTVTRVTELYFACGYEKTVTLGAR